MSFKMFFLSKHKLLLLLSFIIYQITQGQIDTNRYAKGSTLYSKESPNITVNFNNSFRLVGSQTFILFNNSNVTQFYFAKTDKKNKIKALFTIQFEGYLPGINQTYNYDIKDSLRKNGVTFLYSPVYNEPAKVLKDTISSDVWHRFSFLRSQGYYLPDEMIGYRFVKLIDQTKRREILIIYNEDLKNPNTTAFELDNNIKKSDQVMAQLLEE